MGKPKKTALLLSAERIEKTALNQWYIYRHNAQTCQTARDLSLKGRNPHKRTSWETSWKLVRN